MIRKLRSLSGLQVTQEVLSSFREREAQPCRWLSSSNLGHIRSENSEFYTFPTRWRNKVFLGQHCLYETRVYLLIVPAKPVNKEHKEQLLYA